MHVCMHICIYACMRFCLLKAEAISCTGFDGPCMHKHACPCPFGARALPICQTCLACLARALPVHTWMKVREYMVRARTVHCNLVITPRQYFSHRDSCACVSSGVINSSMMYRIARMLGWCIGAACMCVRHRLALPPAHDPSAMHHTSLRWM